MTRGETVSKGDRRRLGAVSSNPLRVAFPIAETKLRPVLRVVFTLPHHP
jgi:hypothetical protein